MLEFKADENFKLSVRHYFHNAASTLESRCVKLLESALDDDLNGAKRWLVNEDGKRSRVMDGDVQARDSRLLDDSAVKVLEAMVSPEELFADEVATLGGYASSFDRDENVATYRARLNRVENEVKAVYFDAASKASALGDTLRSALGDDIAGRLHTMRAIAVATQQLLQKMPASDFIDESSTKRTERVQELLETDRLPVYTGGLGMHEPTFNGLKASVLGSYTSDAFNMIINQPETLEEMHAQGNADDYVNAAVNAVTELVADELSAELERQAREKLEPNADLETVVGSTVPRVVTRIVFSEHKNYGLVRHVRDRLYELLEDTA